MKVKLESEKTYSKYYKAPVSIALSYSGGALPYCTHIKVHCENSGMDSFLVHGDYCANLFEAMDSFKARCKSYKIYDSKGNTCLDSKRAEIALITD